MKKGIGTRRSAALTFVQGGKKVQMQQIDPVALTVFLKSKHDAVQILVIFQTNHEEAWPTVKF